MMSSDSIKREIIASLSKRVGDNQLLQKFVHSFYSYIPIDYNDVYDIEGFIDIAVQSFEYFKRRVLGKHQVQINDEVISSGNNVEGYTIIKIVNDDMPFLVDSVTELLVKKKYRIRQFINALLSVERDKNGYILSVNDENLVKPNESFLYIRVDLIKDSILVDKLLADLCRVLTQVRLTVTDWKPMVAAVDQTLVWFPNSDDENNVFLQWLRSDNFTFTGYREYVLSEYVKNAEITYNHSTDLGILRSEDQDLNDDIIEDIFVANDFSHNNKVVTIGKIRAISKVHRYSSIDYICVLHRSGKGELIARVFIGLFASRLDYQSVLTIPLIRHKVLKVVERAGFNKASFLGKELFSIVETLPRDELFQFAEEDLFQMSMKVLSCLNNPRLLVFSRTAQCKNFLNFLVFFPKPRVTSDVIDKVRNVVKEFASGKFINQMLKISSMSLAYVYLVIRVKDNKKLCLDLSAIEHKLDVVTSLWNEKLGSSIEKKFGKADFNTLLPVYDKAFPANYHVRFTVEEAVDDISYIEKLKDKDDILFSLYQEVNAKKNQFSLKIYNVGNKIELFRIMPIIENLGFQTIEENIFVLDFAKFGLPVFVQNFSLLISNKKTFNLDEIKHNIEEAIAVIYHGKLKNVPINSLILLAGLHWRQVFLLSAYCKYMMQIKFPYSQEYICSVLVKHASLTKYLVELFYNMFDIIPETKSDLSKLKHKIKHDLDKILDSVEDKVIRKVLDLVSNTLRTNYFQKDSNGNQKNYISLKLNSSVIADLPQPRPLVEIFVYSSGMEGIHLRGGKVARGGIRWSDRSEDYRTEVLGLMKAQMTKNSIIIPVGSKGGFLVKNAKQFTNKDEYFAEGVTSYKTLLRGMLDITDNIINRKVVRPRDVICLDGEDPYLVVAADKGTATFSDIANQVSKDYNFWLGDAFASGGSAGYDHKKIGITARGAWISVLEHFRVLGIDCDRDIFTVTGIGDMSGDVFGNGLLLSSNIKLIAAFNHMHIFIDPNPDPAISFEERKRLFHLARSNWSDYNKELISRGGGVFERSAKTICVSSEIMHLLELESDIIDPDSLIRSILVAKVDLLWNGGIGTYAKAESETNEQIGNKENDLVRVNGKDLRCKVVAEGGNLGFTQLARIEYEFHGGKVNTDFIDNSAGVDCSDHEVNIKIALSTAVASGNLSIKSRDELLVKMTEEVSELVLYDNKIQNQSLSISSAHNVNMFESYIRLMRKLEEDKLLDRKIEFLPNDDILNNRASNNLGFTRPEIAVLMSYSKMVIDKNLFKSNLPDDEYCKKYLISYFPSKMQKDYLNEILHHQLRREIISTVVANKLVNNLGSYFFHVAQEYTGLSGCDIARAFCVVWEVFDLDQLWYKIEQSDCKIKTELFGMIQSFVQTSIYWFLRHKPQMLNIKKVIEEFSEIRSLIANIDKLLTGDIKNQFIEKYQYCCDNNLSSEFAKQLAGLNILYSAMDIIVVATSCSMPATKVSLVYFSLGDRFNLDWLKNAADQLPANAYWKRMIIKTIKDDIYDHQRRLTAKIIKSSDKDLSKNVAEWIKLNSKKVEIFDKFISSVKAMVELDSDKLVVATKQIEILTNK